MGPQVKNKDNLAISKNSSLVGHFDHERERESRKRPSRKFFCLAGGCSVPF